MLAEEANELLEVADDEPEHVAGQAEPDPVRESFTQLHVAVRIEPNPVVAPRRQPLGPFGEPQGPVAWTEHNGRNPARREGTGWELVAFEGPDDPVLDASCLLGLDVEAGARVRDNVARRIESVGPDDAGFFWVEDGGQETVALPATAHA